MKFNEERFLSPEAMDRGVPFWAWNCTVDEEKIEEQLRIFQIMGLGGAVIHARNGLNTEYMGDRFMELVRFTVGRASEMGLRIWLYDEDRWPSGCAGGEITKDKRMRRKHLLLTRRQMEHGTDETAYETGTPLLLASFSIDFDENGRMRSFCRCAEGDWHAYALTDADDPRFNGQGYVDTMSREAIGRFRDHTYEGYRSALAEEFGRTVEAIFTDEPQVTRAEMPSAGGDGAEALLPWTADLEETYREAFGSSLTDRIPELVFDYADGSAPQTRYRFHRHVADRFREAFSETLGSYCREKGITFTGHMLFENDLEQQTKCLGDMMPSYSSYGIPGIDVLCGVFELTAAKQVQSAARQNRQKRIMCECYGVTDWKSDFRDYMEQGCWQAALGVTDRVPHLTWMSMLGEGKRDYPACFGYQSPWHREYRRVEDYFARLNNVLREGETEGRVAVLHPIESYWMCFGTKKDTAAERAEMEHAFQRLCRTLLFGCHDFDYINETTLPELYREEDGGVGVARYRAVVIPRLLTVRSSTLEILRRMKEKGVRLLLLDRAPHWVDGAESDAAHVLNDLCETVSESELLSRLRDLRVAEITENGMATDDLICVERRFDGDDRWLYLCRGVAEEQKDACDARRLRIRVDGRHTPVIYDCFTGETAPLNYTVEGDETVIEALLYPCVGILIRLNGGRSSARVPSAEGERIALPMPQVERLEPNVCLLDLAEWRDEWGEMHPMEEALRIDGILRGMTGLPPIMGKLACQPWTVKEEEFHSVSLSFRLVCEEPMSCMLAFEHACRIELNGEKWAITDQSICGFFVDRDIKTIALPLLKKGENILTVHTEIGRKIGVEPMYLLGDFDVYAEDGVFRLCRESGLTYGDLTEQGKPFYSGSLDYHYDTVLPEGDLRLRLGRYRGSAVELLVDGVLLDCSFCPPYEMHLLGDGREHRLTLRLLGNRHNTFASLHCASDDPYCGPARWHKTGEEFTYGYHTSPFGMLTEPVLERLSEEK